MSAMLKSSLIDYPGWIAAIGVVCLVALYTLLTAWVFQKKVEAGLDYASRLPLDKEISHEHAK